MRLNASWQALRWLYSSGCKAAWRSPIAPWMLMWTAILFLGLVVAFASGCSRTVLVPESSPIRIGPAIKGRVYARDGGEWVLSENAVTIPEGWYCVPPSFVEERKP